ncbi:hypothetical protein [uncultured Thiothrix sp.]|uniref:hypothetical protein n=1 Tax=uncultured Thiothrix sp. TaxID=223185 RepID=UPI002634121E|nr:hypothetical protein [uncultured Thiothrix sp.]HMT94451.1 hypothetical protein [Thiolinea sp.]
MMKGIFNYQVPGRAPSMNEITLSNKPNISVSTNTPFQSNTASQADQLTNIQSQILNLLQGVLQKLGLGSGENPVNPPNGDDSTQNKPPKYDHGNNPKCGAVTTQAVGEEDGCIKDPTTVTTLALGEEDGGITTQAVSEEDGGINSGKW